MWHLAVLAGVALLAALGAGVGTAARAEQVHISINDTFVDDQVSAACGFTVTVNVTAEVQATLVRNGAGLIVRELDHAGGGRVTFSSANGSFSFPVQPVVIDYGSGAMIGSSAVVSFVGLLGHAPGFIASDAGLIRLEGVVVEGFDEFGTPVLDFSNAEAVIDAGNREGGENIVPAICAALSGG